MSKLKAEIIQRLTTLVGADSVYTDPADCWVYGYDNSRRHHCPDAVVFPQSHPQVQAIVQLCNEQKIPIVARGRGTATTGATVPIHGGLVISFEKMAAILEIDAENRIARVQPGVVNQTLQTALQAHGLFWGPDPSSAVFSSIGGNLGTNAGGPHALKYGTCRDNTLGLTVVTGRGESLQTGVRTSKGVVGYDLTRLLIGSEGTLAIITEATLKLLPLPETKRTFYASYQDVNSATAAINALMQQPLVPSALEFMDGKAIELIDQYSPGSVNAEARASLLVEIDGAHLDIEQRLQQLVNAARVAGLIDIVVAKDEAMAQQLWQLRKAISPALRNIAPKKINEDVVVPVSKIPLFIKQVERYSQEHNITIVNFGHAGNGNIHVNILVDPDDKIAMHNADICLQKIFALVLELQGTLSGEHGVGLEKKPYIDKELDPTALKLMADIKTLFDPHHLLNPGKMGMHY